MFKSYHAIVIFVLIALLGLVGFIAPNMAEEPNAANISELEATCDLLTDNDEDGRIFKPIYGSYVEKKSSRSIVEGPGPAEYSSIITLKTDYAEIPLHSVVMNENHFEKFYAPKLKEIFEKSERADGKKTIFGFCFYKTASFQAMYEIDTLTIIGSR